MRAIIIYETYETSYVSASQSLPYYIYVSASQSLPYYIYVSASQSLPYYIYVLQSMLIVANQKIMFSCRCR